jgi:hypothetical protein
MSTKNKSEVTATIAIVENTWRSGNTSKYLLLTTNAVTLYGEETKKMFGLSDEWVAENHLREDNGTHIWRFGHIDNA